MSRDQFKKAVLSWYSVFAGIVFSVIGATLWAENAHREIEIRCQSRQATFESAFSRNLDKIYAPKAEVEVNKEILVRVESKLDKLILKLDK